MSEGDWKGKSEGEQEQLPEDPEQKQEVIEPLSDEDLEEVAGGWPGDGGG